MKSPSRLPTCRRSRRGTPGHPASRWLLAAAVATVACSSPLGPQSDDLADARAAWATHGPSAYTFQFRRSCFCGPETVREVRIHVVDGEVVAATYVDDGEPVTRPLEELPTIEDLFDEIADAIDRDAHLLLAEYDPGLGYPTTVSIDFAVEVVDEEMAFEVNEFNGLSAPASAAGAAAR